MMTRKLLHHRRKLDRPGGRAANPARSATVMRMCSRPDRSRTRSNGRESQKRRTPNIPEADLV